jgi:hypothetical protein
MTQYHASELTEKILSRRVAEIGSGISALVSLCLLSSTITTRSLETRIFLSGAAAVLGFSASSQRSTVRRLNAQIQDVEDISDDAYQRSLWHRLNPADARVEIGSTESVEAFNWSDLVTAPDDFPHLFILGKTGAGKTWLGERLLTLLGGGQVITPHRKPGDFKGFPVVGGGRNYQAINAAIVGLVAEMDSRYQRMDQGDESYPWLNVAMDEIPSIASNCGDAVDCLKTLIREARKVKIRLVILSQGDETKTLGIEGEGSLRDNLSYIRLKGFVAGHAKRLKDQRIIQHLKAQTRPCMVEDLVADLGSLPLVGQFGTEPTADRENHNSDSVRHRTNTVEALNRTYNSSLGFSELGQFDNAWESLSPDTKRLRISELKSQGLNQNQIIFVLWGARAGDNKAYKQAVAEFKKLTHRPS